MSAAGDGAAAKEAVAPAIDDDAQRSLGKLVAAATSDLHALLHDEIALFKAETRQDFKRASTGGTALGLAALVIIFGIPVLGFSGAYCLHALGLGLAWSFLIVFGVHLLVGTVIGAYGMRKMRKMRKPERKALSSARETATMISSHLPGRTPPDGRGKNSSAVGRSGS